MATLPTFVKKSEVRVTAPRREDKEASGRMRAEADPYLLRPLPGEDIFFFSKQIDNSRVVRVADPRSRGAAWSAAGAMCLMAILLTGSVAPRIANLFAGYRIESLRLEQQRLIDESQVLDVQLAEAKRMEHMQELAHRQNMSAPKAGQQFDLEPQGGDPLASLAPKAH
jgi:hypothetical protein